jgi:hypothetical protein
LLFVVTACSGGGGGGGSQSVAGSAQLAVSVSRLDFGDRGGTDAAFDVSNSGAGSLDYSLAVDPGNGPPGWLAVAPVNGVSDGELDLIHVTADRTVLAPGAYRGVVRVTAGSDVADVEVALDVVGVQSDPAQVDFGFGADPVAIEVWNWGGGDLDFSVTDQPAWLTVDPSTGASRSTLDRRTLQWSVDRAALAGGHYSGQVVLAPDPDQGTRTTTIGVSMDVPFAGGDLDVTPTVRFQASGVAGGPFAPASQDYTVTNRGDAAVDWTASATQVWLTVSPAGGTLAPGDVTTVTATIDQVQAATLPIGLHRGDVTIINTTNGNGDATCGVDLAVDDPALQAVIYAPPNPTTIAPFTTLFSGIESSAGARPIVKWDWDFGDADPDNPATDEEMLVVHRFAAPGSYTVKLTVTDAVGSSNSTTIQVDVAAFTGRTFYVSSSLGNDANDGASSAAPFQTLAHAFAQMANQQASHPDRLLLRRGDTWVFDAEIDPPTPSLLDAYGSGAQPVLEFTNPDTGLGWYGGSGGTPDDWGYAPVLSNLHLRHPVRNGSSWLVNAYLRGSTFRGCTIENGTVVATLQEEGLVLEECDVSWGRHLGLYSSGGSVVLRRCTFTGSGSDNLYDHQIYLNNGARWLLEDCLFDGAATGRNNNAAKLNGGDGVVVRRCEARGTRNGFDAGRNLEETGGPPADHYLYDECIAHDNGSGGQGTGLFVSWIDHLTVRNCVFYDNDPVGGGRGAIWLWDSNSPSNHVELDNNVFYSNDLPDVYFATAVYDLVLRNNVFVRDGTGNATGFLKLNDPGLMLPRIDSDHNLFWWTGRTAADATFAIGDDAANLSFDEWQGVEGKDPAGLFADPAFTDAANLDFTLTPASPAIDAGEILPAVPRDKSGVSRPRGAAHDAGVFEH